jgi:hypothetical protein
VIARNSLFEPVRDRYGWRLALVFGNHAAGGACPYYAADRCFHCDIGAGEGAAFDRSANGRRLALFRAIYERDLTSISHLVLYNSGSILNSREMPPELLGEILAFARSLPAVCVVSLDSREAYIRPAILTRILSVAGEVIVVRPILGIETADDRLRNEVLQKAMPRSAIDRVFRDLAAVAAECGHSRIGLDVNIVIAGPGTTASTSVTDALATARFALELGARYGVNVDLNLHPYYVGTRGHARFPDHPRCSLATAFKAASEITELVRSMATDSAVFLGLQDEGLDRDGQERVRELSDARAALDQFNQTNDPEIAAYLDNGLNRV